MTLGEEEIALRGRDIAGELGVVATGVLKFYFELVPDGHELADDQRTVVREQLEVGTVCLRRIQPDLDVISFLADEGRRVGQDLDMRPTIAVLRVMLRSLALMLSEDPSRRALAIPLDELREFVIPVVRFWQDF
jgi:hypothetical protein